MEFRVNTDTWFIFSILFISALAVFIFLYVAIPYSTRKKHLNRRVSRTKRNQEKFRKLESKNSEERISSLQEDKQKLQLDLENDLAQLMQSDSRETGLMTFFSNFEKLYPGFGNTLQNLRPDISGHELKLCALIRLNLSSKEISQLLNITPGSVNKARYRLRKKLELSSKEDLYKFLVNI